MFEGKDVTVLLALAGTGKSYRLMQYMEEELKTRRPEEIAFVTFTRRGVQEGLERMQKKFGLTKDDLPYVSTIHSLTFHALDYKAKQILTYFDMKDFNKEYGYFINRAEAKDSMIIHRTQDTMALDYYDMERTGVLSVQDKANFPVPEAYYRLLCKRYEEFKKERDKVDFFDCLLNYKKYGESLPCKVVMVDECFSPDTLVRMADYSVKAIKDIRVGDYVLGTEGATRVTNVHTGTDVMYNVIKGKRQVAFTCNSQHLIQYNNEWKHCKDLVNKRVQIAMHRCVGTEQKLNINPYFFGLWLGNGYSREAVVVCNNKDTETINFLKAYGESNGDAVTLRERQGIIAVEYACQNKGFHTSCNIRKQLESYGFLLSKCKSNEQREYKEKRIPTQFLSSSVSTRLQLLAGIIDSDGMYVKAGNGKKYRIEMARKDLMLDIYNLVCSLGFEPVWYDTLHTKDGTTRPYYRIDFFGSAEIPCLLPRKQYKETERRTMHYRIEEAYTGEYVGITVDAADHLFVLANGCIVHNCQDLTLLQWQVVEKAFANAEKVYLAGDVMQCIFSYSGSKPEFLINLAKKYKTEKLLMSYRVPTKINELANALISFMHSEITTRGVPRPENGLGSIESLANFEQLLPAINPAVQPKSSCSWYILARSNYFLADIQTQLESKLIPYWNHDGFFMGGVIMQRIKAYYKYRLQGYKNEDKKLKFMQDYKIVDFNRPITDCALFDSERSAVYQAYIDLYGLPLLEAMEKWTPQILVSTIHTVKGGEAENVALLLDLTKKCKETMQENLEEELRVLYVAVTRAKKNLYLIDSKNGQGYDNIIQICKSEFGLDF